ncbi:MAG TPA: hypothetical protein DCE42_20830 [Myxococcales bacterium]|nr:hypothetical protein [Deltaproteobacteria bacterium]HAA57224.1 hypothetical protein [Myxococcales bacterium]|tara:strand:+ start:14392 stop:14904 length:513 start_codon:yes stop_codon:yes gene_type:complete
MLGSKQGFLFLFFVWSFIMATISPYTWPNRVQEILFAHLDELEEAFSDLSPEWFESQEEICGKKPISHERLLDGIRTGRLNGPLSALPAELMVEHKVLPIQFDQENSFVSVLTSLDFDDLDALRTVHSCANVRELRVYRTLDVVLETIFSVLSSELSLEEDLYESMGYLQ